MKSKSMIIYKISSLLVPMIFLISSGNAFALAESGALDHKPTVQINQQANPSTFMMIAKDHISNKKGDERSSCS